jgi:hypothetical protein
MALSPRRPRGLVFWVKGTSLRTVQEALDRANLETTSIYVQLAREVMNKELQEHALQLTLGQQLSFQSSLVLELQCKTR